MNRYLIPTILLVGSALAAQPTKNVSAPAPVQPLAAAPAPPAPATAPIPFAPLEEAPPPEAAPDLTADDGVDVYFEEGSVRFLVFDKQGWLPDVKRLRMIVVVGSRVLELVSYPGPYAPTTPETRKYNLTKISTLTPAEFQAKLDEVSRGTAQQNGVASR